MSGPGSFGERPPKSDEKNYGYITEIPREEEAIPGGMTTIVIIAVMSLLCVLICISGLIALLRRRRSGGAGGAAGPGGHHDSAPHVGGGYAVQNRHFNADPRDMEINNCMNCRMIEMGSMACYTDVCPQCGRPPPNR